MTKHSAGSKNPPGRAHGDRGALPAPGDAACDLYSPGHQIHYKHQGNAVRSPALPVRDTLVDGTHATLLLVDGRELYWRHHDPDRLSRILELLRGRCVAYPEWHALRVGPYWFNCSAQADQWQECRVSRTPSHA
jgi:hypothetical protein